MYTKTELFQRMIHCIAVRATRLCLWFNSTRLPISTNQKKNLYFWNKRRLLQQQLLFFLYKKKENKRKRQTNTVSVSSNRLEYTTTRTQNQKETVETWMRTHYRLFSNGKVSGSQCSTEKVKYSAIWIWHDALSLIFSLPDWKFV